METRMSDRRPSFQDVLQRAKESGASSVYTLMPAKIVKWDAGKQRANVKVLVKNASEGEGEERIVESWPVIAGIKVQFIEAGGFRLTCPISDGNLTIDGARIPATTGSLIFAARSLDKWMSGNGDEVDPEIDHVHDPSDAVFFPGLRTFGSPLQSCPTDHMTLGADAGVQIHFHGQTIVLGTESGAEKMLLAETLIADLKAAATTINTILLAGTTGGPTAQNITQAAQWALTQLYLRLQADGVAYLSTEIKNK